MKVQENIEIDIFSFIKDGTFGNIEIGMSKDEILRIFPPPEDGIYGFKMKYSPIWRYGNFELHFENQRLIFIFIDCLDNISVGNQLRIKKWLFENNKYIYLQDVLNEFDKCKVLFDKVIKGDCVEIIIKNVNIVLTFFDEVNSNMKKMISMTKK